MKVRAQWQQWACLTWQVGTAACGIQRCVSPLPFFSPSSLHSTFRHWESSSVRGEFPSQGETNFSMSYKVCSVFNKLILPSSSVGQPRTMAVACVILGPPWPINLFYGWHRGFYLITHAFCFGSRFVHWCRVPLFRLFYFSFSLNQHTYLWFSINVFHMSQALVNSHLTHSPPFLPSSTLSL